MNPLTELLLYIPLLAIVWFAIFAAIYKHTSSPLWPAAFILATWFPFEIITEKKSQQKNK